MAELMPLSTHVPFLTILLLFHFGSAITQSNPAVDKPRLPPYELKALDDFGVSDTTVCDETYSNLFKCNCSYENNSICHITFIDLSDRYLDGTLAASLGNLRSLTYLDLSNNQLHGTLLASLGNLSSLAYLDLSGNQLTGCIPQSLGNLRALQYLYLGGNFLTGSIPPSLRNLSSLKQLDLYGNIFSGQIPKELGSLSNLRVMVLSENELTGQLPPELGRLRSLGLLSLSSNNLKGELPGTYANFTSEMKSFSAAGNSLTGKIPRFIANWTQLYELLLFGNNFEGELPREVFNMSNLEVLEISDLRNSGFSFPKYANLSSIETLVLRNCSINGQIPPYIGDWSQLNQLDLSFNNLSGGIPDSMKKLNLSKMFLMRNNLDGTIPSWLPRIVQIKADLSYNNFKNGGKDPWGRPKMEPTRNTILELRDKSRRKPQYDSLYINCGGSETPFEGKQYEGDSSTLDFYKTSKVNWAYSCSGDFRSKTADSTDYIKNAECIGACNSSETELYNSSRLCPLSLTYYGFCLFKGNYTLQLHFAETVFIKHEDYTLGRRVFDVYIQGERRLKDFTISEKDRASGKPMTKNFTAHVGDDHVLEIHFFWAGKGSFPESTSDPESALLAFNGPLVSAISVTANFKVGKKLSPSQIAGITVASVFAPLFLLAFMWKMGWLGKSELDEIIVEVQGRYFTLKQIINTTRNFSPRMEVGRGRFGTVYKAELSNQIKLAVKKISPQTKQQGKDELQREIVNLKSLRHENLVQLLVGYSKKGLHLLVYEYMEKGSLHHTLFEPNSGTKLDWKARYDICLGIAKGLKHLHEEKRFKIVHGNIKGSNIMLDKNLTAKLSDFGLAKLYDEEDPFMTVKAKGWRVYMAPEYAMGKAITVKADVFSFGVVVLEIVSGKTGAEYKPNQEADFLLDTAGVLYEKGRILDLVDKKLSSSYDRKQALTVLHLAIKCINQSPTLRPTMSEVVSVLMGEKNIQQISQGDTSSENIGGFMIHVPGCWK